MRARHAALIAALPMILTAACLPSGLAEPSGREDFADYCAACHGPDGSGQGAVAAVLDAAPADLTMLSESNDGTFPKARVMSKIWGYTRMKDPQSEVMPRFSDLLQGDRVVLYDSGDGIATPTPIRLVQLAEYIEKLQK
jgi:mono/diheme cytochrome c family protein